MKRLILYHNDADGRCSAAIAGRHAVDRGIEPYYLIAEYGQDLPDLSRYQLSCPNDEIFLVDFSYPHETMLKLIRMVGPSHFVWIDHHKTALEELDDLEVKTAEIPGARDVDHAACILTWRHCFPGEPTPWAVEYIADRDIWAFQHGNLTRYFYEMYINAQDTHPGSFWWDEMFSIEMENLNRILTRQGSWLYNARINGLRKIANRIGQEIMLSMPNGSEVKMVRCLKVNHIGSGDLGQVIKEKGYDVAWCYVEERKNGVLQRNNSVYSNKYDVSILAEKNGGGGHRGAAGWVEVIE